MTQANKLPATYRQYGLILLAAVAWLIGFGEALWSAAGVWWSNETFNHCFFVIPGAFYLAWQDREKLAQQPIKPSWLAGLSLLPVLLLGLLGFAADVQLFTHVSAFLSFSIIIWLLLGDKAAAVIYYPLLFVLFAIPMGDELIPLFQKITADMAVTLLSWVNIPIFRTGLYIEIPAGKFVVAEACSGVRFFVASVAFSFFYAYISYKSLKKKLAFIALGVIVPIIANGFRVFGIIIVAHLSDMKYATGADHLTYGWIFFSIVLLVLIAVGEFIRSSEDKQADEQQRINWQQWLKPFNSRLLIGLLALMLAFKGWQSIVTAEQQVAHSQLNMAEKIEASQPIVEHNRPQFSGFSDEYEQQYYVNNRQYDLYVAWYPINKPGSEIVNYANRLYDIERWTLVRKMPQKVATLAGDISVEFQYLTTSYGQQRLLAYWYQLGEKTVTSPLELILRQALDKLMGGKGSAAVVVFSTAYQAGEEGMASDEIKQEILRRASDVMSWLPDE